MSNPEPRISKEMAPEVFALASRLYAQQEQSYSLSELMEAGAEAKIPPEYIQQAVQQIQAEHSQARKRPWFKDALVGAGVAIASLSLFALAGQMGSGCHSITSMMDSQINQSR